MARVLAHASGSACRYDAGAMPDQPAPASPEELIELIRASVIGDDEAVAGPFGLRRVTYADYTASGRNLTFIEDYIREQVMPLYANTHTESSGTGLPDVALPRGCPRHHPCRASGAARGATRSSSAARAPRPPSTSSSASSTCASRPTSIAATACARASRPDERPVVFIGPFEHHSNELPWRESIADVVTIREDRDGHIDLAHLADELARHADRPLRIGSFSAASNVTGIHSDTRAISVLLHRHGALAFWDYGAAAPYLEMNMTPAPAGARTATAADAALDYKDAIVPLAPQVHRRPGHARPARRAPRAAHELGAHRARRRHRGLRQRRRARLPRRPRAPRGGRHAGHHRVDPRRPRLPAQGAGRRRGHPRPRGVVHRARPGGLDRRCPGSRSWATCARAGSPSSASSSATASAISTTTTWWRCSTTSSASSRAAAAPARGPTATGCWASTSSGPTASSARSCHGCEGIKPGWVRVNFNYFISEAVFGFILEAVELVARDRLAPAAAVPLRAGERPLAARRRPGAEPPLSLHDIRYSPTGHGLPVPPAPRAGVATGRLPRGGPGAAGRPRRRLRHRPQGAATWRSARTSRPCAGSSCPTRQPPSWRRRPAPPSRPPEPGRCVAGAASYETGQ